MLNMEYKKEFKGTNVYIDKMKIFMLCNDNNKEIIAKFIPTIFEDDVSLKAVESKPTRTYAKRKAK